VEITFVETGIHSPMGERLKARKSYLKGDEVFPVQTTVMVE